MELYGETAALISRLLTQHYSSSFASASRLFPKDVQKHIYNIYGLVRIADEIVDTYRGSDAAQILSELQVECHAAIRRQYSANPIVHSFASTAGRFGITKSLIDPFFASMAMDIPSQKYSQQQYEDYIYGSAEVVGLMCLKVFCDNDKAQYNELAPGARRLGEAFQKVNFLRDIAADYTELKRFYFPGMTFQTFDDAAKQAVITDIKNDFVVARPYILALPPAVRPAVMTSYRYYEGLLHKLEQTDSATLKSRRVRLPAYQKALLLAPQVMKVHR